MKQSAEFCGGALADFAAAYADQHEQHHQTLLPAVQKVCLEVYLAR
jgi:hypothetical protein